ncbi:MAG: hypothetical protein ABIQ52_04700 [Vicinamibacterales bacterium]
MLLAILLLLQAQPAGCRDVAECRTEARGAYARGDFEIFHDLAWRAVQKGRANDPDVMQLLARAQALSGRPGDALVMLGRLADLGIPTDAATSPDFAIVRLLPGWTLLEAKLTGKSAPASSAGATSPVVPTTIASPAVAAPPASSPAPAAVSTAPDRAPTTTPADRLEFDAPGLDAHGLAHDAVSRRFVVGDRKARRLLVIDEVSRRVVNYVSAASAGFYEDLTAFTVDARRGDLWVVSVKGEGAAASSVLHKLQLVSGRGLMEARAAEAASPLRLVDVAVSPDGVVYALDAADPRILRLRPGARTLDVVMRLDARRPTVLAAADDRILYVGAEGGLMRVDVVARTVTPVKTTEKLTDFESLAWRGGALLGVQRLAGSSLIVRVPLDSSGTRANPRHVLAASPAATVGALGGDTYYYLADDHSIRRLPLK